MRGFEDSLNPVHVKVDWIEAEQLIDGKRAQFVEDGLLVNIGDTRYWVPRERIVYIKQVQPAEVVPPDPILVPRTPPGPSDRSSVRPTDDGTVTR
jgi:hypothetical protein